MRDTQQIIHPRQAARKTDTLGNAVRVGVGVGPATHTAHKASALADVIDGQGACMDVPDEADVPDEPGPSASAPSSTDDASSKDGAPPERPKPWWDGHPDIKAMIARTEREIYGDPGDGPDQTDQSSPSASFT